MQDVQVMGKYRHGVCPEQCVAKLVTMGIIHNSFFQIPRYNTNCPKYLIGFQHVFSQCCY